MWTTSSSRSASWRTATRPPSRPPPTHHRWSGCTPSASPETRWVRGAATAVTSSTPPRQRSRRRGAVPSSTCEVTRAGASVSRAKLRAYELQDDGLDTIDANLALGLPVDAREYGAAVEILRDLGVDVRAAALRQPCQGDRSPRSGDGRGPRRAARADPARERALPEHQAGPDGPRRDRARHRRPRKEPGASCSPGGSRWRASSQDATRPSSAPETVTSSRSSARAWTVSSPPAPATRSS